ncbi:MAG: hypothetical protein M3O84_08900 [Actinomycetota bacterium]|nr:hypothetical protein [Actinomycetota bacterium]
MKSISVRGGAFAVGIALLILPACGGRQYQQATCSPNDTALVLAAQAVPSATLLPCIESFPAGWIFGGSDVRNGLDRFWLDSDRAGPRAVEVSLTSSCDVSKAVEVTPAPDEAGTRRYEEPTSLPPNFQAIRYYTFPGGCVSYRFAFASEASSTLVFEADQALSFSARSVFVKKVQQDTGLSLCGAGAKTCPG